MGELTLALAGDTMLGRGVAHQLRSRPASEVVGERLLEVLAEADATILNLECCISTRGSPWPDRVFHFRAPPQAVELLHLLGVRCVTLANNHAMDFGETALLDTVDHLGRAGIALAGAGATRAEARAPATVSVGGGDVTVVSVTDDPPEYAAGEASPGVAWVDPHEMVPPWLATLVGDSRRAGAVTLVSPHWGPNMIPGPLDRVRRAAADLVGAGATLVAGHSAHVFHGVQGRVLFDLGDFVDDYAVGPLRNDLGLLWLVTIDASGPTRLQAVPLRLSFCHTDVARGDDHAWVSDRFGRACGELGTEVQRHDGRLLVTLR